MLKQVVSAVVFWLIVYLSFSVQAISQVVQDGARSSSNQDISQDDEPPLTHLGNEFHNGIELLQNRFRIDYEVNEITLIFFREYGSAPIVLVQPDGSKIFESDADGESIFWFDTSTYDMVSIKNPTPGPWQAIGQIEPESRVMVLSDLILHADPLPSVMFSGERLKHTAYLTNAGAPIDYSGFRDAVELSIELSSTNNPNFNNFGADSEIVALFEDDGKGMDERPRDGVFTGQFKLGIAAGHWVPTFSVSTPMYTREQVDPSILLLPNPIEIDVELDGGGDGYHKLTVDAQRENVDMSSLLIDGKVRFPNGDIQNFSITDMSADVREHLIVNFEYGIYRVKLTAYGNTTQGREFILDVPEYSFLSEEPEPVVVSVDLGEGEGEGEGVVDPAMQSVKMQKQKTSEQELTAADETMTTSTLVSLIIAINLFILIVGGGLIWWLTSEKKSNIKIKKNTKTSEHQNDVDKKLGFFTKVFKGKTKQTTKQK